MEADDRKGKVMDTGLVDRLVGVGTVEVDFADDWYKHQDRRKVLNFLDSPYI